VVVLVGVTDGANPSLQAALPTAHDREPTPSTVLPLPRRISARELQSEAPA